MSKPMRTKLEMHNFGGINQVPMSARRASAKSRCRCQSDIRLSGDPGLTAMAAFGVWLKIETGDDLVSCHYLGEVSIKSRRADERH